MTESATDPIQDQSTHRLPASAGVAGAVVMLGLFESVGVRSINLTIIDQAGSKVAFRRYRTVDSLRVALPDLVLASSERRLNVIVRPIVSAEFLLIQLDDLTAFQVDRAEAFAFLVLETSPSNFQAWLAAKDADSDIACRVKKAIGADPNASGATRLAGSYNFKLKYAPDYPRVRLQSISPHRQVTVGELERAGLIASDESVLAFASRAPRPRRNHHRFLVWPSYERCLVDAPDAKNHDGKDRSAADFEFCLICIDRGWSLEATAEELMKVSEKARLLGHRNALLTSIRAASIVNVNQARKGGR